MLGGCSTVLDSQKQKGQPKGNMKFTEKSIRDLRVESGRQVFSDDTVKGLVVKVSDSGHKAFYIFYRLGRGRKYLKQQLKLGDVGQPPTLTVKDSLI